MGCRGGTQPRRCVVVVFAANYPGMTLPPGPGLFELEPGALGAATDVTDAGVAEVGSRGRGSVQPVSWSSAQVAGATPE